MTFRRAIRALVRFCFHLFYNQFAFTYDFVSAVVSRGHWRDWTRAAIPRIVGTRVLEVPCGSGNLLLDMDAAGYRPIGADLSASMVGIARGKLKRAQRVTPQQREQRPVPLLRARVETMPFAAAAFDSIVMTFPPEFVFDPRALQELRRVLDDRGRLIWVDAGRLHSSGVWNRVLNGALDAVGGEGNFERVAAKVLTGAGFECQIETIRDDASTVKVAMGTKSQMTQVPLTRP